MEYNVAGWFYDNCDRITIKGNDLQCICPFCGDKQRRFHFDLEKQLFNCFKGSCQTSGRGFTGLLFKLGYDKSETLRYALGTTSKRKKVEVKITTQVADPDDFDEIIRNNSVASHPEIDKFRESRKIPSDYPLFFGVNPNYNFYKRIIIPVIYEGKILYYQARAIVDCDLKYLNPKADKDILPIFRSNLFNPALPVVVTEGILDVITSLIKNMTTQFGVPSENFIQRVLGLTDKVIIALDNDDPGYKRLLKLADIYRDRVRYFIWPQYLTNLGYKDFNDLVCRKGLVGDELFLFILRNSYSYIQVELLVQGKKRLYKRRNIFEN